MIEILTSIKALLGIIPWGIKGTKLEQGKTYVITHSGRLNVLAVAGTPLYALYVQYPFAVFRWVRTAPTLFGMPVVFKGMNEKHDVTTLVDTRGSRFAEVGSAYMAAFMPITEDADFPSTIGVGDD